MPRPQSAASHASNDHVMGFFVALPLLANFVLAVYYTIRQWPMHSRSHLWWIVMSLALIVQLARIRSYATKNQDRIIRLEERIRYLTLLTPEDVALSQQLALPQIIALRFASDAELPSLIHRTLSEKLEPKQIKLAISTWRPDFQRV